MCLFCISYYFCQFYFRNTSITFWSSILNCVHVVLLLNFLITMISVALQEIGLRLYTEPHVQFHGYRHGQRFSGSLWAGDDPCECE